jgi:hypothetical protein
VIQLSLLASWSTAELICIRITNSVDTSFYQVVGYNPLVSHEINKWAKTCNSETMELKISEVILVSFLKVLGVSLLFWMVQGFELRASCLLGRRFAT